MLHKFTFICLSRAVSHLPEIAVTATNFTDDKANKWLHCELKQLAQTVERLYKTKQEAKKSH